MIQVEGGRAISIVSTNPRSNGYDFNDDDDDDNLDHPSSNLKSSTF